MRRCHWLAGANMRRRDFLKAVGGGAAAWPLATHAQQPAMPQIGFLSTRLAGDVARMVKGFHKGLAEAGFTEGRNVVVIYPAMM